MLTTLFTALLPLSLTAAPTPTAPPAWAADVIWYQIFVERFRNGDPTNDPRPADFDRSFQVPPNWAVTPWNSDWYAPQPWAAAAHLDHNAELSVRRYGGDLQGVLDKLDYLHELGITALYFNPLNDAPSLHKYDARSYHHIDANFGPDPAGDRRLMAAENPADPATWQWTAADKLFLKVIAEAHRRGMRVVLDYSWNHTGTEFWAWQDVVKHQQQSAYKDWYAIKSFADPAVPGSTFAYEGWAGVKSLPEIRKVDVVGPRQSGHPYEGNLDPGPKAHILAVTRRWLAPDGDVSRGLDGYRLDVADQVPMGFWREYRSFVKSINPEAYLVGEVWWEQWPDRLMNPVPYCSGDVFDAVMFYQAYRPARAFFARHTADSLSAQGMADSLRFQWERLAPPYRYAMMGVNATHDAPRLLTCFANPSKYKYHATPHDDPHYVTGKPDTDTYRRVRLYLLHQFTSIGAPAIWNGDELGMWGSDDPDCRKPLWWPDVAFAPERRLADRAGAADGPHDPVGYDAEHHAWYRQLIKLRREHPVLTHGELEFLRTDGKLLAYRRHDARTHQQAVVLFNLSARPARFALPGSGKWESLLDPGAKAVKGSVTLAALSGAVYQPAGQQVMR